MGTSKKTNDLNWRIALILAFVIFILLVGKMLYGQTVPLAPIVPKTHTHFATVLQVVSADLYKIETPSGLGMAKLYGVDCSAKCKTPACAQAQKDAFEEAKRRLEKNNIMLECDGDCKFDRFKRRFHYIALPDISDFGLSLISRGLCAARKYVHNRSDAYLAAQKSAQDAKLGRWQ